MASSNWLWMLRPAAEPSPAGSIESQLSGNAMEFSAQPSAHQGHLTVSQYRSLTGEHSHSLTGQKAHSLMNWKSGAIRESVGVHRHLTQSKIGS